MIGFLALVSIGGHAARAESVQSTMAVSLEVAPACSATAAPLAFAAHAGDAAEARAAIAIRCTHAGEVSVTLDTGRHAQAGVRQLADGSGRRIAYDIYRDPAHARRWGAGADAVAAAVSPGGTQLVAYGRVEGRDTAGRAGSYADTVTVTVDF